MLSVQVGPFVRGKATASRVLYSYGLYNYGLFFVTLYSYGLYDYGLFFHDPI